MVQGGYVYVVGIIIIIILYNIVLLMMMIEYCCWCRGGINGVHLLGYCCCILFKYLQYLSHTQTHKLNRYTHQIIK